MKISNVCLVFAYTTKFGTVFYDSVMEVVYIIIGITYYSVYAQIYFSNYLNKRRRIMNLNLILKAIGDSTRLKGL